VVSSCQDHPKNTNSSTRIGTMNIKRRTPWRTSRWGRGIVQHPLAVAGQQLAANAYHSTSGTLASHGHQVPPATS